MAVIQASTPDREQNHSLLKVHLVGFDLIQALGSSPQPGQNSEAPSQHIQTNLRYQPFGCQLYCAVADGVWTNCSGKSKVLNGGRSGSGPDSPHEGCPPVLQQFISSGCTISCLLIRPRRYVIWPYPTTAEKLVALHFRVKSTQVLALFHIQNANLALRTFLRPRNYWLTKQHKILPADCIPIEKALQSLCSLEKTSCISALGCCIVRHRGLRFLFALWYGLYAYHERGTTPW